MASPQVTRLAPSPTGQLHLGNARTFLANWLLARQRHWHIQLRIEDLDGPRVRAGADADAISDLHWLGLDWDTGPVYQSARTDIYAAAINGLLARGLAYPCVCSRKEALSASSAPHPEDGGFVYPGTCRGRFANVEDAIKQAGRTPAIRFAVPDKTVRWTDTFVGECFYDAAKRLGDFIIAKADGSAAYQIAVVVDDAEAGVTQVVRGDDLIDSAARQILLYEALDMPHKTPTYTHLPLVVGPDGKRLAKRHGEARLASFREAGVAPAQILHTLAQWINIPTRCDEKTAQGFVGRFDLSAVSRERVIFHGFDVER